MTSPGEGRGDTPEPASSTQTPNGDGAEIVSARRAPDAIVGRRGTVAKVSHTLDAALAERLEAFAFYQRVSESSVIEHALNAFFALSSDDGELGDQLRKSGAGRRRKS